MDNPLPFPERATILIVDDTPANLRLLTQVLQSAGYRVRAATSGARALAAVRASLPDMVLLDVRIPDMDGYSVCAQLKADARTADVPIIFISALNDLDAKLSAFDAGAVDYISKPIQPGEVLARVRTHLALRDLHSRLASANDSLAERLADLQDSNARLQQEIDARARAERQIARLLDSERERAGLLERLRAAATAISGELDLARLQHVVVAEAAELLGARGAALSLHSELRSQLEDAASIGEPPALAASAVQRVVGARQAILVGDEAAEPHPDARPALVAPLLAGGRLVGVLAVGPRAGHGYSPSDVHLLGLFAQQAAMVLQHARLFAEMQQLAHTDPLTGLHNRRHFFTVAQRAVALARQSATALALLMLDIDHFKQVNDRHGHIVGDQALRAVADLCRDRLRLVDVVGRYGGEELVILLPDTDLWGAQQVAERLRHAVEETPVHTSAGALHITVSLGVASSQGGVADVSLDAMLDHADQALYVAKQAGRNRLALWNQPASDLLFHAAG